MNSAESPDSENQDASDISLLDNDQPEKYTISQTLFEDLQKMGFSENAIKKSIVAGCIDQSTCIQWITMHTDHPELDAPLANGVEVTVKCKKVLTEAEREQKVKELQEKIKEKKEETKKESHRKKVELTEMWRKSLEVKEEMDQVRRQTQLDEIKRDKASDREAYRQIKIGIIADRYKRQGKSSDEAHMLAVKEYDEEQLQKRQIAADRLKDLKVAPDDHPHEASKGEWNLNSVLDTRNDHSTHLHTFYAAPAPTMEEVSTLISDIRRVADESEGAQCVRVLLTIFGNIRDSPFDIKKRTLKTGSKLLSQHVLRHESAVRLMRVCNFDIVVDADGNELLVCTTVIIHVLNEIIKALE
ncbi:unnamed protein product [Phytomonas sp. Hart1]|nr:unnamed protein product [Phytomonas sp. Hart1]|eukprot:CCW67117.1 unnamed protein product [Phytomonas sp. isolate Hart1]